HRRLADGLPSAPAGGLRDSRVVVARGERPPEPPDHRLPRFPRPRSSLGQLVWAGPRRRAGHALGTALRRLLRRAGPRHPLRRLVATGANGAAAPGAGASPGAGAGPAAHTLNRKWITSPSRTT